MVSNKNDLIPEEQPGLTHTHRTYILLCLLASEHRALFLVQEITENI